MKLGLVQLTSSDDPLSNLKQTTRYIEHLADQNADLICTPEMTNILTSQSQKLDQSLFTEATDPTLKILRELAEKLNVSISIGSLALKTENNPLFVNRSFMISNHGDIIASYDKIHMFDASISETESYQESKQYQQGKQLVIADTAWGGVGMSICYDLRFPAFYRDLAQKTAKVILVPSAFTRPTGQAHWEILLRARAIETGCFIVAAAQTGEHPCSGGISRKTHGHSMVISPWGTVLLDAGQAQGTFICDIDLEQVDKARSRIPAWQQNNSWSF